MTESSSFFHLFFDWNFLLVFAPQAVRHSEIQHVLTNALVEIKPVKLLLCCTSFLWCLHPYDAFSAFNACHSCFYKGQPVCSWATSFPISAGFTLGAFVSSGWQNFISVFRFEFWMEVWEIVACVAVEPTLLKIDSSTWFWLVSKNYLWFVLKKNYLKHFMLQDLFGATD